MPSKGPKRIRSPELHWLAVNREWLERDYAGDYVALVASVMVAHGPDPLEVRDEAVRQGYPRALIHRVLPTEYQGMKFVR